MKGGHDLGGKPGMGKVNLEAENQEPVFHADWERRVFAMNIASGMLGRWNIDESRHARERQEPADYLKHSYYENWLEGLEKLLLEKGLLEARELQASRPLAESVLPAGLRVPNSEQARKLLRAPGSSLMQAEKTPLYAIGDSVRVKENHSAGHTRVPGYAQGATGIIVDALGCHIYPDKNAHGEHIGEQLYTVRFSAAQLWGPNAENDEVLIDLWEPYLSPADKHQELK
mgnify:FL=1